MMARVLIGCVVAAGVALLSSAAAQSMPAGEAARGERLYAARCSACHSLDVNRIGPRHRGVVGRRAASVADFTYSPALRRLNAITWDAASLDRWLTNPAAMAPGAAMGIRVASPQERADIIAYLRANPAR
jgi:cytochrome c